jgi:hypothetical protein
MTRYLVLLICVVFGVVTRGFTQGRPNIAFKSGEELTYRIYYSSAIIDATAGEAILTIIQTGADKIVKNDTIFHVTGIGFSKGLFDLFFKVRDTYESYFDRQTLLPDIFIRNTHEGSYSRYDSVEFNQKGLSAKTSRKELTIPPKTFDILSPVYYMRTLQIEDFNSDSIYLINFYLDDSVYRSAIKYLGRDTLTGKQGKIPTLKLAPMMATGEVFADKYPMFVWVTDDENHIPVFATSAIIVGAVNVELIKYKNLSHPFIKP